MGSMQMRSSAFTYVWNCNLLLFPIGGGVFVFNMFYNMQIWMRFTA